jgi:DNA-binding MarR family transcriptional regulator
VGRGQGTTVDDGQGAALGGQSNAVPAAQERSGTQESPDTSAHPTAGLSETVHQRHRLGILTITSRARQADFGYLRETLGLTSGNLSTHLTVLEDAGLVRVEKGYEGRRPRTWVSITREGRAALADELAALARLIGEHTEHTEHTAAQETGITGGTGGSYERDE